MRSNIAPYPIFAFPLFWLPVAAYWSLCYTNFMEHIHNENNPKTPQDMDQPGPSDATQPSAGAPSATPLWDAEPGWQPEQPEERSGLPRWALILLITLAAIGALFFFLRPGCRSGPAPAQAAATAQPVPQTATDFSGLAMWTLDVGQGDCILLRGPSGATMLVDAGPAGSFGSIHRFLQKQGVTRLDLVVCSHLHIDHIGGMKEILDHYEVGTLCLPPFDIESSTYANMLEALEENGAEVMTLTASLTPLSLWDPSCQVYALAPYEVAYDDENDTSIILRVAYNHTAVLLTGDATELSERLTVKAMPNQLIKANVLKVGHHGSDTSTSARFLQAVQPEIAVISVASDNQYGLPDETVLNRLEKQNVQVLRTDIDGTVLIALDGERAWVVE